MKVQNEWFVFKNAHISLCEKSAMLLSFTIKYTAAIVSSVGVVLIMLLSEWKILNWLRQILLIKMTGKGFLADISHNGESSSI